MTTLEFINFFLKREAIQQQNREHPANIKACFRPLYRSLLCIYMFLQIIIYSNNENIFLPCLPGSNFLKKSLNIYFTNAFRNLDPCIAMNLHTPASLVNISIDLT